jgi:glutathione S-transferase
MGDVEAPFWRHWMLTIYGRANSSNVQLVMWAVGELGLEHDAARLRPCAWRPRHAGLRAMNPHGKVPVLQDGDLVVWESMAILRYLAARYGDGGAFWPGDPARARGSTCGPSMARTSWPGLHRADLLGARAHRRPPTATRRRFRAAVARFETLLDPLDGATGGAALVAGRT